MRAIGILVCCLWSALPVYLSAFPVADTAWQERLTRWAHPEPIRQKEISFQIPLQQHPLPSYFPNVNLIVSPENDPVPVQNESSIAVNPVNPSVLIASAVDYRRNSSTWVYISTDGGRTWINKNLGKPFPSWVSSNDPSVAFDATGRGYLCYGGFDVSQPRTGENGVFVAITTDNGQTWQAHIPVILHTGPQTPDSAFEDKYYITVDNSSTSPYRLTAYIPWKRVIARDSSTQIVLARSTDGGLTWSAPVPVSHRLPHSSEDTTFGQSFPLAATGPNGEVYVVWNYGPEHGIGFAKSTDGGQSFSEPRIIVRYQPLGTAREIPGGIRHTVKGGVRAETYPVLVCDTLPGERNGYLYLCWAAGSIPSVYFSRSTDGGETWSTPIIVHSDATNDQFWPWMSQDPVTGYLAIMYLDSRDDPNNILTYTYVSISTDGGLTWVDRRVADIGSDIRRNPFQGNSFAGDYSGCAFYDGIVYPSWVDMRNTIVSTLDNDVYTAIVDVQAPLPVDTLIATVLPQQPTALLLSWDSVRSRVFGQPLSAKEIRYVLRRQSQVIAVFSGSQHQYLDTGLVPFDTVLYELQVVVGEDTSKSVHTVGYPGGARQPAPPAMQLVAAGSETVELEVYLPTRRADGQTPLVNLAAVWLYRDGELLKTIPVARTDTGSVIRIRDTVSQPGFYTYAVAVADAMDPPNVSERTPRILLFVGTPVSTLAENFDDADVPRYFNAGWKRSGEFTHSPPFALTESPGQRYERRAKDTLILFPVRVQSGEGVQIRFWHAALIHHTDTGFVEIAWNTLERWEKLLATNREDYPAWKDGVMDASDWKEETLVVAPPTAQDSLLFVRFRFKAGVIGNDEGWYLDDIRIQAISTVAELQRSDLRVYPIPTARWLVVESAGRPVPVELWSLQGRIVPATEYAVHESAGRYLLDVQKIPPGAYILRVGEVRKIVWIVR